MTAGTFPLVWNNDVQMKFTEGFNDMEVGQILLTRMDHFISFQEHDITASTDCRIGIIGQ